MPGRKQIQLKHTKKAIGRRIVYKNYLPNVYLCWHSGFSHSMVSPVIVHCSASRASFSR